MDRVAVSFRRQTYNDVPPRWRSDLGFERPRPVCPDRAGDVIKEKFAALNEFVQLRGGWLVSVPGDPGIRLQVLPGSPLPDQLAAQGYTVVPTGTTQRILAHAVAQPMTMSSSGALIAATEGSTKPVTMTITNAGITTVETFDLRMP
jgi:hypothetical protein